MLKNTDTVVKAVRYAVRAQGAWKTFVEENAITTDMIAETARELAALAYPNDEPVQKSGGKRTRFGNAVQAAGAGMRYTLNREDSDDTTATPDYLALFVRAAQTAREKGEVSSQALVDALHSVVNSAS